MYDHYDCAQQMNVYPLPLHTNEENGSALKAHVYEKIFESFFDCSLARELQKIHPHINKNEKYEIIHNA